MTQQRARTVTAGGYGNEEARAQQRSSSEAILEEIHLLRLDIGDLLSFLRQQAEANEPVLYCPPDEHCPGGFRLYKHKPEYWKNDGKDNDRLYHALPETDWYEIQGDLGTIRVKNHNVWRSRALTVGGDAQPQEREDAAFEPF